MRSLGIILVGLAAAIMAAVLQLASGAGVWAALAAYLLVGTITTALGMLLLIKRAWDAERPAEKLVLRPLASGASD